MQNPEKEKTEQSRVWTATAVGTAAVVGIWAVWRFRRFETVHDIPKVMFPKRMPDQTRSFRSLFGYITRVGDGDNFRFFHTPGGYWLGWHWLRKVPTSRSDLASKTISVRLAGVDAPESGHFGKKAQPFSLEAKQFLSKTLLHRNVRITPLKIDQYSRLVAGVQYYPISHFFWKRDIGPAMVQKGLAVVYDGTDGVFYPSSKERLQFLEKKAKKKQLCLWSQGKHLVLPSEHKRNS
ncbi:mitochondrial nuclease Lcl3, implicated in DNA repair [Schizosaccharomyces osmophilus]|uniref:Mitochondrial nuclease Lcl3, implicated in DNA repair n=1 Tax=Schizosaccharomyces osmophilus TaxID=2545709 RepID=A0AAE9W9J3_9SCHI|nr:mitochondrial nuclease Lcl3, implicated in DNA repair [Schizosaccharomyces osmophilus]WBW71830.1 mitochondrial nuclease Lcl3, implicated in DNA repair [Schizosaccharomyces osmophilus]